MRWIVPGVLLLVAVIHLLPLMGVVGVERLFSLYGVAVNEPNLEILLRHRAVLFGLLGTFIGYAAFHPPLHRLALVAAIVSVASFVWLCSSVGSANRSLSVVLRVDLLALALLLVAAAVHAWRPSGGTSS